MARQKGIIKVKGSLGGLTFYERGGEDLARETSDISRERILTDPAYARTRENMSEFGGSATAGKALRAGLAGVARGFGDFTFVGRVVRLMKKLNLNGTGLRGQRSFNARTNGSLLTGFEFNKQTVLSSVFNALFGLQTNADRNEATLTVPDFDTSAFTAAPEGATHFRLVCAIATLSDYVYNNGTGKFEPTDEAENGLGAVQYSAEIPLGGPVGAVTTVTATLQGAPTLPATVALVACVGIEYVQELNGQYYLLASNNAMRIAMVF
jgi:hypothetical protein